MARLIDADELLEKFGELGWLDDTPLDEIIKEQPTAYDVDKVVEQLEKQANDCETNMFARQDDDWYGMLQNGVSQGYQDAIDIVKEGGVNVND